MAGKLDVLFKRLDAMMQSPFSRTETSIIKVKCPCGCNHEFDVEVKQSVSGSITDFSAWTGQGGSILNQCMWTKK